MKVVINRSIGGFGLSYKAVMRYAKIKGIALFPWIDEAFTEACGEKATFDNPHVTKHYSTRPIVNGKYPSGTFFNEHDISRSDPALVRVVEKLGKDANGPFASLKVVEIPDEIAWGIENRAGLESIFEKHRTWR